LEGGKDPDEIARKSAGVWREMVETSVDVYEYVMEKAFQKFDKKSMEGVKKISEEVMPFLEKINNVIVRELWVKKLADRLGVSEGVVFSELMKERNRGAGRLAVTESGAVRSVGKKEKMAKKLVRYMAVMPKIRGDVSSWIGGWSLSGALGKIIEWLCEQKEENVGKLKEMMPMELTEAFAEAYMEDEGEKFEEKDVREATVGLLREVIKENKMALTGEMRKARQEQDEDKEEKILVELNELNKKESKLLTLLG
jgi:DNA primase